MNKLSKQIIIIVLIVYFFFGIYLFLNQRNMLYFPDNQKFNDCQGFLEYEKINYKGTRFYFKNNSQDILIYYHGNAGSACDRSYSKSIFEKTNKSILYLEYSGYSGDTQKPTQELILKDVENLHEYLKFQNFNKTIVYGQSIGAGAASYHTYLGGVDKLILVTPFSTLVSLAQSKYKIYPATILLRERYNNIKWLKDYNKELVILHGDKDIVIPNKFSKELYNNLLTQEKEYIIIEGAGHNNIWSSQDFIEQLSNKLI